MDDEEEKEKRINERRIKITLSRKIVSNDMQKNTRHSPNNISHNKLIHTTVSNHRHSHLESPKPRERVRLNANKEEEKQKKCWATAETE